MRAWHWGLGLLAAAVVAGWLFWGGQDEERQRRKRRAAPSEAAASAEAAAPEWDAGRDQPGRRRRLRDAGGEDAAEVQALAALGYVAEGDDVQGGPTGIVKHDPSRAQRGTNLVVSAHAYEILLLDMDGRVLHTWKPDDASIPVESKVNGFRKALLLPDGSVYGVVEGEGLLRMDVSGKVVWRSDLNHHHDLHLDASGSLHTLAREVRTIRAFRPRPTVEDRIVVFGPDGTMTREISVLKALAKSPFKDLFEKAKAAPIDVLHTNSLHILDGSLQKQNPAFAKGRYLLSFRTISTVAVLDPLTETIVWAQEGPWRHQHDPVELGDELLVFDNDTPGPSTVLRYNLGIEAETWRWGGSEGSSFYTSCCGTAQPLANGNLLVVVTDEGRALEITKAGKVVWAYQSDHTVARGEKVARLFDLVRAPVASQLAWLEAL